MSITVFSAGELAQHEFPDEAFIVEPLMPQGGMILLHGKRGIGKSQFALTLSHAIVNGLPLFNHFPTTKGTVVFVQADMTPKIQQLRLLKIYDHLKLENLYYTFPVPCNVAQFSKSHPIVEAILKVEPKLIIWDTLRKIHRLKESSSESVQVVYENLKQYFPGITHMLVHHDKKTFADNEGLDQEELFRGSGAWVDDADTSIQITQTGTRKTRMKLWIHKCRTMSESERPNLIVEMDPQTMMLHPHSPNTSYDEVKKIRKEDPRISSDDLITELLRRGCCTREQAKTALRVIV